MNVLLRVDYWDGSGTRHPRGTVVQVTDWVGNRLINAGKAKETTLPADSIARGAPPPGAAPTPIGGASGDKGARGDKRPLGDAGSGGGTGAVVGPETRVLPAGIDSVRLQRNINDASLDRVKLVLPQGEYDFRSINMRSHVHLEIEQGTIIRAAPKEGPRNSNAIFDLGVRGDPISDCSIVGLEAGYTVDFTSVSDTEFQSLANFQAVTDFRFENAHIQDNKSILAKLLLTVRGDPLAEGERPRNGRIKNCSIDNAAAGYGLSQIYAMDDVHFHNITGTGGVTLRLETDNLTMKELGIGGVRKLTASKVRCENGLCPVMVSPHFMPNYDIDIDEVYAKSCAFAVRLVAGFVEDFGELDQANDDHRKAILEALGPGNEGAIDFIYRRNNGRTPVVRFKNSERVLVQEKFNMTPGFFKDIKITNVVAEHGNLAHFPAPLLAHLPRQEQLALLRDPGSRPNVMIGSSIAIVSDLAGGPEGSYDAGIVDVLDDRSVWPDRLPRRIDHTSPTQTFVNFLNRPLAPRGVSLRKKGIAMTTYKNLLTELAGRHGVEVDDRWNEESLVEALEQAGVDVSEISYLSTADNAEIAIRLIDFETDPKKPKPGDTDVLVGVHEAQELVRAGMAVYA